MPVSFAPTQRATNLSTSNQYIPNANRLNNCNNTLCFTYNHNYIYKPHTAYGRVGTTSASYIASRRRL